MKKIFRPLLLTILLGLVGCSTAKQISLDNYVSQSQNMGQIGSFDLVNPLNNITVENISEFSWTAAENAERYSLEICSNENFVSTVDTVDYYKRDNITDTKFKFSSTFAYRDTTYYWRVTAINSAGKKVSNSTFTFYVQALAVEEFAFDLGDADDWKLHNLCSPATIEMDNSNFFGNKEKSLKVSFKEEDMNRGIEESDGWIIVTKTIEKEIYGTDGLYFNCFYAGQDSTIFIRVVDRDNEFWHCPIQISNNARQSVVIKFDDFEQRTKDVTVGNFTFDHDKIKYLEVVFERTFGDGVFLMSGMKAIKYDNYKHLFIQKLNYNDFDETKYVTDNYAFDYEFLTDNELKMDFYGSGNSVGKPAINGYGFVKLNANRYFVTGDSIKISVKYTGGKGNNIVLRVYEEDTDRWMFRIPYKSLTEGQYSTITIPYTAFGVSQLTGDGKRQFYYVLNIQFGLEGQYSTGSIYFKDLEVVTAKNPAVTPTRTVGNNGVIENFDNYTYNSEMYFIWTQSVNNKDEYMALNQDLKVGQSNVQCGQFEYKSDMEPALYYLPLDMQASTAFNAFSIWLKDTSIKSKDDRAIGITDYRPTVSIYIRLSTSEIYSYTINKLNRLWYKYDIPFSSFTITNEDDLLVPKQDITSGAITHIGVSFSYTYYDPATGKHMPLYSQNNPVLLDNLCFVNLIGGYRAACKERVVSRGAGNIALVDNFDSYMDEDITDYWIEANPDLDYSGKTITNDVSSVGGTNSVGFNYLTKTEKKNCPKYYIAPALQENVIDDTTPLFRTFSINLKSEFPATVYVSLITKVSGKENEYQATFANVNSQWTEYKKGFKYFKLTSDTTENINNSDLKYLYRISITMVYTSASSEIESRVFVDNIAFDANYNSYTTDISTVLSQEGYV